MYFRIRRLFTIYVACHASKAEPTLMDKVRLAPGFAWAGVQAFPYALRWVRLRDPAARARVKQILDMSGPAPIAMDRSLLEERGSKISVPSDAGLTIVMPVYGNLAMTQEALRRVIEHTDVPWRLILIDDASPNEDVKPSLERFAGTHPEAVEFISLEQNLGFVGAVNIGLERALGYGDPVVLLNTDAYVPQGWASRLLAPIWNDEHVATVTPLSNDAELGCVPKISTPQAIDAELADKVDAFARTLGGDVSEITAPAGVGFCMAMSHSFLQNEPAFDEVFAPGYAEEVDWCQKAIRAGGKHIYVPNLFVAHMGGQSFGSEAKARLIARNSEVLSRRYPQFDASVFAFVRNDPLVSARLALGLSWIVAAAPSVAMTIFIGHSMGGGAEIDLKRRLAEEVTARGAAIVVRFGGVFRFTVELWWQGIEEPVSAGTNDWSDVERLLAPVLKRHVVYSNAVGDLDPIEVPIFINKLIIDDDVALTVLVHDYFILSPSVTLLGASDTYVWPCDDDDPHHQSRRIGGATVSLSQWRDGWRPLMGRAEQIVCFSEASAGLVMDVYGAHLNIVCIPHSLPVHVPVVERPQGRAVIGVLGNISPHKGAALVQALSSVLRDDNELSMVLIGDIDPGFKVSGNGRVHGSYDVSELPSLVRQYGITCWLIPSIWPETFSFTTHEAIVSGLPVVVFDLGAQGDAVRRHIESGGQGAVITLSNSHDAQTDIIDAARAFQHSSLLA